MTIAAALEIALAMLVLGMAAWTIAARETFAAVVGFVAYGLLLALVWVRLDAVDVALTEAAIGGLSGILLVGAAARLRASETPAVAEAADGMLRIGAAVLATMVAAALAAGVLALPDPAPTLAPAVAANAAMWLLVMTAGLTDAPPVRLRWLRLLLIAGPAVFLVVGLAGLWLGDGFLSYPVAYAKPLILTIEVAMTLTIAVTLGLLLAGAPERSA
jgi:uncharacterized MnhB-related membrane protein